MSLWLPTLFVIIETAIALSWARFPPTAAIGRRIWFASLFAFGFLAIAATVWQGRLQLDEITAVAGTTFSSQTSVRPGSWSIDSELDRQLKVLKDRIRELEGERHSRAIAPEVADRLAAYLKQFGSRRVVVSCVPDDLEAYHYATQLMNVLKTGGWDATGPEITRIFGEPRAPLISVYGNSQDNSDTERILLDGFTKFNIPYETKVAPSLAISDPNSVELFIGKAQFPQDSATGD